MPETPATGPPGPDATEPCIRAASAGVVRRLLATYVDMVLFCSLSIGLLWPVLGSIDWASLPRDFDRVAQAVADPAWLSHASGILGIWIALWWVYFTVGWGLFGATPGKWLLGLRVVDYRGRCPIGLVRSVMRLVAYMVSSLTLGIGHLLIVVRGDRCALHDLLAGTRVVRWRSLRRSAPDPRRRADST